MSTVPTITLNDGATIPQLGFGTFQISPEGTAEAVRMALAAGYRHVDTAQMYGNEGAVGQAVAGSGVPREELFLTTKLDNDQHGYDSAVRGLDASLTRLGTNYVDLFLIHWPLPGQGRYVETWQAFEKLAADGRARSIGVSNFQPAHLQELLERTTTVPAVNQIELHPYLQQPELRDYHRRHAIATEAWSPIARADALDEDMITDLADKYGKTPAQVVLRWQLQLGNIVFPKSVTPSRIGENLDVFDLELAEENMRAIGDLDAGTRYGPDPDTFGG